MLSSDRVHLTLSRTPIPVPSAAPPFTPLPDHSTVQVLSLEISEMRDHHAIVDATIVYPGPGWHAEGYRYAMISTTSYDDGVGGVLARGEIAGIPLAMAGDVIDIEIVCRAPDHAGRVTAALAEARTMLGKSLAPEDDYDVLAMVPLSLRTDPVTHVVTAFPFGGRASAVDTPIALFGEGAAAGTSNIMSAPQITITSDPAERADLVAVAVWEQAYTGKVDVGPAVPEFHTYTADEFRRSLDQFRGGDSDHVIMHASSLASTTGSKTITTRPPYLDPATCYLIPARTMTINRQRPNLTIDVAITARTPRTEKARFQVTTNIGSVGGARSKVESEINVLAAPDLARDDKTLSYSIGPGTRARRFANHRSSAFLAAKPSPSRNVLALGSVAVYNACVHAAVRHALSSIYCVTIDLDVTIHAAMLARLDGRATVHDVRLPGGKATGWIVSISRSFGSRDSAQISLLCPLVSAAPTLTGDYADVKMMSGSPYRVRVHALPDQAYAPTTGETNARIILGRASDFLEGASIENDAAAQEAALDALTDGNGTPYSYGDTTTRSVMAIADPRDNIPETTLGLSFKSHPAQPLVTDEYQIADIQIQIAEGIRLG